jgi:uncharacterized protein YkwD
VLRWTLKSLVFGTVFVALSAAPAYARTATEATMVSENAGAASHAIRSTQSTGSTKSSQTTMMALAHGVVFQLNEIRSAHGLPPLTLNTQLSAAAEQHTSEMITDGYFAHESHDGAAFWKRLGSYTNSAKHSWGVGENLLWSAGEVESSEALKLWMESPDHRANILSPDWRQIGIAAVHADSAPGAFGDGPVTVITTDFGVRT